MSHEVEAENSIKRLQNSMQLTYVSSQKGKKSQKQD